MRQTIAGLVLLLALCSTAKGQTAVEGEAQQQDSGSQRQAAALRQAGHVMAAEDLEVHEPPRSPEYRKPRKPKRSRGAVQPFGPITADRHADPWPKLHAQWRYSLVGRTTGKLITSLTCALRPTAFIYFSPSAETSEHLAGTIAWRYRQAYGTETCIIPVAVDGQQRLSSPETVDAYLKSRSNSFEAFIFQERGAVSIFPPPSALLIDRWGTGLHVDLSSEDGILLFENSLNSLVADRSPDSSIKLAPEPGERGPEEELTNALFSEVANRLREEDFASLEKMASSLRSTHARWESGDWQLVDFYRAAIGSRIENEKTQLERIRALEEWQGYYPESITAAVALAEAWYQAAWKARGKAPSRALTDEQSAQFAERMAKAKEILKTAGRLRKKCPEFYALKIRIAGNEGASRAVLDKIYRGGLATYPDFHHLHSALAECLLPDWTGAPGEWEAFADQAAAEFGPEAYARIALSIGASQVKFGWHGETLLQNSRLSWQKLRRGLGVVVKKFPSMRNLNLYAMFASAAGDQATANGLFRRIGDAYDPAVWGNNINFEHWRRWSASED